MLLVLLIIILTVFKDVKSNQSDCPYNPDEYLTTPQIIRRHGYEAESHIVQTTDGYLLTLHRVLPKNNKKRKQPVLLQHGLLSSSTDWVISGNNSLAFILANQGYDVWLGNIRGNIYSRAHTSLPPESPAFWNFTFHEMAIYDLPAFIYHIKNVTETRHLLYVGHSMGTTMFFAFSSILPNVAKNIVAMAALSPVVYMTHIKSPIRYLAPWANDYERGNKTACNILNNNNFKFIAKHLGLNEFLPSSKIMQFLSRGCDISAGKEFCADILFVLCGFDRFEFNEALLPVIMSHHPAGTSTKTVIHYLQEIKNSGNFQQFDYGPEGNWIKYGQLTPPSYPLKEIRVPMYFIYGDNDWLASPIDVKRLFNEIGNNASLYEVPIWSFNHLDFLYGKHAGNLVYKPLLKYLEQFPSE